MTPTPSPERPTLREAARALLKELEWVNEQLDLMPDDYAEAQRNVRLALSTEEASLPSREAIARVIAWEAFRCVSLEKTPEATETACWGTADAILEMFQHGV